MRKGALCLSAAAMLASAGRGQEQRAPDFDTDKVQASWVVSLPKDYSDAKRWPLILDLHGAIAPGRKGAVIMRKRLW
ncbi:MAG: hypothetical protein ACE5F1_03855 [Planctomycetota bacterium]